MTQSVTFATVDIIKVEPKDGTPSRLKEFTGYAIYDMGAVMVLKLLNQRNLVIIYKPYFHYHHIMIADCHGKAHERLFTHAHQAFYGTNEDIVKSVGCIEFDVWCSNRILEYSDTFNYWGLPSDITLSLHGEV